MGNKDYKQVNEIYDACKTTAESYRPLWQDISKFVGINVQPDYAYQGSYSSKSRQLDSDINDPTSAISVNQAGDYMAGMMWGTGEEILNLVPSRHVLREASKASVEPFYAYATGQTLYHMNHPQTGYTSDLRSSMYDMSAFGTSGIGIFPNTAFKDGTEDNALISRMYGVDNMVIDEGKGGLVDYVFVTYSWRTARIVGDFAMTNGVVDPKKLSTLPKGVQDAWKEKDFNKVHQIVFGMMPNDDYEPGKKGNKAARYRGVWFAAQKGNSQGNATGGDFFLEETFSARPINVARMIKIRGEIWGRASGTMLISTIRSVDYMVGTAIEIMEKMADPALGVFNSAIFGDSVLDSSPSGLTVFNQEMSAGSGNPVFPLYDVGDPSSIIQFLIPYLNNKITTAFKIDMLLDFNSDNTMTATETLERSVIRGQALSGIAIQLKNERLTPDVDRSVSVLWDLDELGVNPNRDPDIAEQVAGIGRNDMVIPQAVIDVRNRGRAWYEIQWNNDMERVVRTAKVQNLLQVLNGIMAVYQVYPDIVHAVKWYQLLKEINDNLDANNQIMHSESKFKQIIEQAAQQRGAQAQLQEGQVASDIARNSADALKKTKEANNA